MTVLNKSEKKFIVEFTTYAEGKYKTTIARNLGGEKWIYRCNIYLPGRNLLLKDRRHDNHKLFILGMYMKTLQQPLR